MGSQLQMLNARQHLILSLFYLSVVLHDPILCHFFITREREIRKSGGKKDIYIRKCQHVKL